MTLPRVVSSSMVLGVAVLGIGCDRSPVAPVPPSEQADAVQVVSADESAVPDSVREAYRQDAARLALRYLYAVEDPATDEIELPIEPARSLYHALLHVYLSHGPARDAVAETYGVHTFGYPETRGLYVGVLPEHEWVDAWRRGEDLTGNLQVDALVMEFDLHLERYYDFSASPEDLAVLVANRDLNLIPLAERFEAIDGVRYAGPNAVGGDGADVQAFALPTAWRLDYSVGYGDCPAGCIYRHYWVFEVTTEGSVRFLGERGDPAPTPGAPD